MNNREDCLRSTIKQVYPRTPADGEHLQKRRTERWLFGAMFLWPVILLACDAIGTSILNGWLSYVAAYIASPIFAAILMGIALHYYPVSRRFLKWFAAAILIVAVYIGQMYYLDSLQHGWRWTRDAVETPIFWLDVVLVVLSVLLIILPERAWGQIRAAAVHMWKWLRGEIVKAGFMLRRHKTPQS